MQGKTHNVKPPVRNKPCVTAKKALQRHFYANKRPRAAKRPYKMVEKMLTDSLFWCVVNRNRADKTHQFGFQHVNDAEPSSFRGWRKRRLFWV